MGLRFSKDPKGIRMPGYLAGLGVLVHLIMRGEHDTLLSCGFGSTWSTWVTWVYITGFAPQTPDAQHLYGSTQYISLLLYYICYQHELSKAKIKTEIWTFRQIQVK